VWKIWFTFKATLYRDDKDNYLNCACRWNAAKSDARKSVRDYEVEIHVTKKANRTR